MPATSAAMAAASPTPMGSSHNNYGPIRKPSLRGSALRQVPSRTQLDRASSNLLTKTTTVARRPSVASNPAAPRAVFAIAPTAGARDNTDSSDDEIIVPMKLSAITRAVLNESESVDGESHNGSVKTTTSSSSAAAAAAAARYRTRSRSHRSTSPEAASHPKEPETQQKRRSVVSASAVSSSGAERNRHSRTSSAQIASRPSSPARSQASRENSPVRKRVVKLSTTPGANSSQLKSAKRRSTSSSQGTVRPRSSSGHNGQDEKDKANAPEPKELNTPQPQPAKSVRILSASSGHDRSSGVSSRYSSRRTSAYTSTGRTDATSHPGSDDEEDGDDAAPVTAPCHRGSLSYGSVSRHGSFGARSRADESQASQSQSGAQSVRVKRVGKVAGSFLSGPARRGRRQFSEGDGDDGEPLAQSDNPDEGQGQQDLKDLVDFPPIEKDNVAPSHYAPDRIASGSPVSAKSSARRGREGSVLEKAATPPEEVLPTPQPDRDEIHIPHYRIPPSRAEMLSGHDQENEAPSTFRRTKPMNLLLDRDMSDLKFASRPAVAQAHPNSGSHGRAGSPERKPLTAMDQNTPHRPAPPPPPPKMSMLETATSVAGAATAQHSTKRRNLLKLNGKHYTKLDVLGRGGSGKVYRVHADNGRMYALKRVSLENADANTVRGFKGEIDLLGRLKGLDRVITLIDYEMNDERQLLSLLMEMGELDLNKLLGQRYCSESAKFDPVFVRYYWQEMLECLAAVHSRDIVHSDLKPANFVLVQGRLKLIDFGIANAIQTDETVNVHRETQIGTPNYMSPESLIDSNNNNTGAAPRPAAGQQPRAKLMKLGKPSDIWSLGCILYQMVYGTPPFGHIANQISRCQAIINWDYGITFRERGIGDVPVPPSLLRTMKRCLHREAHLRPTCEELLARTDPFLYPAEQLDEGQMPISEELLGRIVQNVVARCRERVPSEAEALNLWAPAYWSGVVKARGKEGV